MAKKKEIKLTRGDFDTVWRNGRRKGSIEVDVYLKGKLIIEWAYSKVCGQQIFANACFWLDQSILQAKAEVEQ